MRFSSCETRYSICGFVLAFTTAYKSEIALKIDTALVEANNKFACDH